MIRIIVTFMVLLFVLQVVSAQEKDDAPKFIPLVSDVRPKVISMPKPEFTQGGINVGGTVSVIVTIDEEGNVIKAESVSGHPLLRPFAEKAAMKAKFEPLLLSGKPVKIRFPIVYNFVLKENSQLQTEENKIPRKPVLNGLATYLPKPEYSQEAKNFCAEGTVTVEVEIDETGRVISAEAISGDDLLREAAVEAARKAKFRVTNSGGSPIKVKGIVVYNFPAAKKCIEKGIVNDRAKLLPRPNFPKSCRCSGNVDVQVVIDENGDVIRANAISGHPLLRLSAENAARQAKFPPTNDVGKIRVKGILIYNFETDGTIKTNLSDKEKNFIGKPINLVKPPNADCNCKFAKKDNVIVEAEIDEQGNVIKAVAISGHPFLKAVSIQAARSSQFSPTKVSGISVKAKAVISYEFVSSGKWTAKLINIAVKSIEAVEK